MTSPLDSPPPREIFVIEKLARAVAVCGLEREELILRSHYMVECLEHEELILRRRHYMVECSTFKTYADYGTVLMVKRSDLLKSPDHPYHDMYKKKRDAYIAQCRDGMICSRRPNFDDLKPPPNRDVNPPPPLIANPPQDITPFELGLVKVTALFVARYGIQFWHGLIDMHVFPYFSFLKCTDKSFGYYNGLVGLYQRFLRPHRVLPDADEALGEFFRYLQLEKLHDKRVIDLHALTYGLDCIEVNYDSPPPATSPSFSLMMLHEEDDIEPDAEPDPIPGNRIFPVRISLKELGIIKLTALFVARYGECFLRVLMMREVTNPHFDFLFFRRFQRPHYPSMEPAEIRFNVFDLLVVEYSEIVTPSEMAKMANYIDYCSLVVFGVFHQCLQLKKLEEGVKTATIDLHAFVAGVDYLAHIHKPQYSALMSPPQRLSAMIKNQPTLQTHPGVLVLLPLRPKVSDYPPQFLCAEYRFPPRIEPDELAVIKLTAQFVTRYDASFKEALEKIAARTTEFEFLKLDHGSNGLFLSFVELYCTILKPSTKVEKGGDHVAKALEFFFLCLQLNKLKKNGGVDSTTTTSVMELSCFLSGLDYFAWMDVVPYSAIYSAILTAPERRSVMMNRLKRIYTGGGGLDQPPTLRTPLSFPSTCDGGFVSHNEIGIIKLTAVFVARYGVRICREMMKKVGPVLKFMEPGDERFHLYETAVDAYSKVVKDSDHVVTETVIERYLQCVQWEEQKKGSMTFVDDLYGFVEGVDCFAQMEDEYFCGIMGNHLLDSPYNQQHDDEEASSSESKPKRQKVDVSASVLEGSSSRIKVCVPTVDGRKVMEVTVESWVSEKVASLKEKIGEMIQMQAKELKLRRKSGGVLKEDKSLADNNVEAGEILTLTWRISRWTW